MEKFDLDDDQEVHFEIPDTEEVGYTSEGATEGGVPEDNVYTAEGEDEEFAFLREIVGEDYASDPRNTYKISNKDNNWPEYQYQTSGGKNITVRHDPMGTLWSVVFDGGQMPPELKGKFTNDREACQAVEIYLARNA